MQIVIGAVLSLVTSWLVAHQYFKRQRRIDEARERKEVDLAFARLVHAHFPFLRKRLKRSSELHLAMSELETKLKIYRSTWDAKTTIESAAKEAQKTINEHPEDFEDI